MLRLFDRSLWVAGFGLLALFVYVVGYERLLVELALIVCSFPFAAWTEWRRPKTRTKTLSFSSEAWRKIEGSAKE